MRFPTPDAVNVGSIRGAGSPTPVQDNTGVDIARGVSGFAQGLDQAAGAIDQIATRQFNQDNAVDISRAEAFKTASYLDIQNRVAKDNNYGAYADTYTPQVNDALGKAGDLIRDPRTRERWMADQASTKATMMDAIHDRSVTLHDDYNRAGLEQSLKDNMQLAADPTVPVEVRDKARKDMDGLIQMGESTGLIEPGKAVELRGAYLKGADQALAGNLAELDILSDPQRVITGMAIPGHDGHASILDASLAADGHAPVLEYSLASQTAKLLGDANFPTNPKDAAAYLSDPQKALDYSEAAQAQLSDRYKGDLTAVVIAMDPNGGTALADKWVSSNHSESVLPANVKARYQDVMSRMVVEQPYQRIPLQPGPNVDVNSIDPGVLDRFEQLQSRFGMALPLVQSAPSRPHGAPAIEVDVSGLDKDQRTKLIEMGSTMGFAGIGIGKDTLHFGIGDLRAVGPDGTADSVPAWAKDAASAHASGSVKALPTLYSGVAPEYQGLSFDQRLTLYNKAKAALNDRNVDTRASIATIAENAPAAIASTGKYDGDMPTATQFVQAFGAADGIQKYRQFESEVDTSKTVFGMKTATNQQIMDQMQASTATSSGNDAALQVKREQQVKTAGKSVLDARAKDPAGYVLDAFPSVAAAYQAATQDKSKMPQALQAMAEAQKQLGIENPMLLPKALAASAADTFKDKTLPAQQRIAGVVGLVLSVTDPAQQDAIFSQIVGEGAPAMLAGPLNAMRRGDAGAAQNLLRAALFDPDTLKVQLPQGQSDGDIKSKLLDEVFSPGKIGDITYGMTGATADNFDQAKGAADLMFNDVKQRLVDGSAGGDLDKAVELAKADLFGDDQILTGNGGAWYRPGSAGTGLKVTVPKEAPPDAIRTGFNNLVPLVKQAIGSAMAFPMPGAPPDVNLGVQWSVQNYTDAVLSEGYFMNADGFLPNGQKGYAFYDPHTDAAVPGPNGQPLVFSLQDVMAASQGANVGQQRTLARDAGR